MAIGGNLDSFGLVPRCSGEGLAIEYRMQGHPSGHHEHVPLKEFRDLVKDLAVVLQSLKTVGATSWDIEHLPILSGQNNGKMMLKGQRGGT